MHKSKFTLNHHYFDDIDTEDKAYFLGLLYADGCNYFNSKSNNTYLALQVKDEEILKKFNKYLETDRHLSYTRAKIANHSDVCKLTINSKHLCETLIKQGCPPQKTFVLKFPTGKQVPHKLIKHFIRGYFDGDGSISSHMYKSGYVRLSCCFVSTLEFCSSLAKLIKAKFDCNCYIDKRHKDSKNNFNLRLNSNDNIIDFLNWLYEDSYIYLERKFCKFKELKNIVEQRRLFTQNDRKRIYQIDIKTFKILHIFKSVAGASLSTNIPEKSIINAATQSVTNASTAGGYFWAYIGEYHKIFNKIPTDTRVQVGKFDLKSHQLITKYPSVKTAAEEHNIDPSCIWQNLSGKSKQSHGFLWKRI